LSEEPGSVTVAAMGNFFHPGLSSELNCQQPPLTLFDCFNVLVAKGSREPLSDNVGY
jgi:hypothetical protein